MIFNSIIALSHCIHVRYCIEPMYSSPYLLNQFTQILVKHFGSKMIQLSINYFLKKIYLIFVLCFMSRMWNWVRTPRVFPYFNVNLLIWIDLKYSPYHQRIPYHTFVDFWRGFLTLHLYNSCFFFFFLYFMFWIQTWVFTKSYLWTLWISLISIFSWVKANVLNF